MVKNIAILGSCVTRDNFNSLFNKNYKMFFDVVAYHHQSSVLSLMSKPLPFIEGEDLTSLRDFDKWHLRSELSKEFLGLLANKNIDYLIIDFYGDLYNSVIKLDDENYLTDNPKFKNLSFFKNHKNRMNIKDEKDLFLVLWKEKVDAFFRFIKEVTPNTKVILNRSRFADTFENGKSLTAFRKQMNIQTIDVDEMNAIWDILDNYVIDNYDVITIDMNEKTYHLSETHPWKAFYVHYTMDFYDDFFHKILNFDVNQLQIEMEHTKKKIENMVHELECTKKKTEDMAHEIETSKKTISLVTNQINDLNQSNLDLLSKINVMENENLIGFIKRKRAFKKEDR